MVTDLLLRKERKTRIYKTLAKPRHLYTGPL